MARRVARTRSCRPRHAGRWDIMTTMADAPDDDLADGQVPRRMLIFMPSWVGDVVMATPTLRALREHFADTHLAVLVREQLVPLVEACPWIDRVLAVPPKGGPRRSSPALGRVGGPRVVHSGRRGLVPIARWLRTGGFDLAVLLPNSFRSAMVARMARIQRRVGYDRESRGVLLTDRLVPRRCDGRFIPVSAVGYYLALAQYLGAASDNTKMSLFVDGATRDRTRARLAEIGIDRPESLVVLTPGANFGAAKLWPVERFAAVADHCRRALGLAVVVAGSPQERTILENLCGRAAEPVINLQAHGFGLREVMATILDARLVVTNDTGPRHIAAAFDTPVVSIFGPTDPAWTDIGFERERQVAVKVFCGPCQLKRCPLDHRCMTRIDPTVVIHQIHELLKEPRLSEGRPVAIESK